MERIDERGLIESVRRLPHGAALLTRLPEDLWPAVHLVGGSVRDLLLGGSPTDLDLVVEGPPAPVAALLAGQVRSHERFGTLTVKLGDGASYDIAGARRERYAAPGALPDVEPANLDEDLLRRDFTVNALALALTGPDRGRLRAAPGGREDLRGKTLRVLHDGSFSDDPTRLLRLVRYYARLGFSIDPHTLVLLDGAIAGGALATVSGARIGNELRALAREHDPIAALDALRELGLGEALAHGFGIIDSELAERALELLGDGGRRDLLALALGSRGVDQAELRTLLDAFAFEAGERDAILEAATGADDLAERLRHARRPSEVVASVGRARPELVALAGALGPAQPARDWLRSLRHARLQIDGNDLLAAGVPAGPAIGLGLRVAKAALLDGRAEDRGRQLEAALEVARPASR